MPSNSILLYYTKAERVTLNFQSEQNNWFICKEVGRKKIYFYIGEGKFTANIWFQNQKEEQPHPLQLLSLFTEALRKRANETSLASFVENNYYKYLYQIRQLLNL